MKKAKSKSGAKSVPSTNRTQEGRLHEARPLLVSPVIVGDRLDSYPIVPFGHSRSILVAKGRGTEELEPGLPRAAASCPSGRPALRFQPAVELARLECICRVSPGKRIILDLAAS
jgi:hypothetical protein